MRAALSRARREDRTTGPRVPATRDEPRSRPWGERLGAEDRRDPVGPPSALEHALVEPILPAFPEFDRIGREPKPGPEGRAGNSARRQFSIPLRVAGFQLRATSGEGTTLLGRVGGHLVSS